MTPSQISIGITLGDVSGIGPEVVAKALLNHSWPSFVQFRIYGTETIFRLAMTLIGHHVIPENICFSSALECEGTDFDPSLHGGRLGRDWGRLALLSIDQALRDFDQGFVQALVTAPINKEACQKAGFKFKGHTDYLADYFGNPTHSMMFYSKDFKVLLVSHHLSLREAIDKFSKDDLLKSIQMALLAKDLLPGKPIEKVLVAGLNPHAGENGLLGNEEKDMITPVVEQFQKEGQPVFGPYPLDTIFINPKDRSSSIFIALTHDHGLIPFKLLAFDEGVNFTIGLPLLRTSPDHGTAHNIAWKGIANEKSMMEAIDLAIQMAEKKHERN